MIKIYNTQTRTKEELVSVVPGEIRMYVCGPTVYDYIHVGNARPLIFFDVVKRYLEYRGYKVFMARNITDIDDKIIKKANAEGVSFDEIASRYTKAFLEDAKALNTEEPTYTPKATEHIADIIEIIEKLIANGNAYPAANGDVYFDTRAFEPYGELSGQNIDDLEAGARISVDEEKHDPMDFALWKSAKPGEPFWPSPWGNGRPGWHIECSAMSMRYLGASLDIHGGGQDLIFPHHENEKAQSEGASGKQFVRYWMHNGYININNRKMSKSEGNFFTVRDIFTRFKPEVLRFFQLSSHYRSPINFSSELMEAAQNAMQRLYTFRSMLEEYKGADVDEGDINLLIDKTRADFIAAMDDDFNTADALSAIFEFARAANIYFAKPCSVDDARRALALLDELCSVLGILYERESALSPEVQSLAAQRVEARKNKDWAQSDRLRDQLKAMGYSVEDTKDGQKVRAL